MMKTTKLKIEKALKHFESTDFSIREVCEKSGVSYPTIKSYLSNLPIREVSYGRYEIIEEVKETHTDKTQIETLTQNLTRNKASKSNTNGKNDPEVIKESLRQELLKNTEIDKKIHGDDYEEVYGEIYIAAYLKGFDRGFELGLQKNKETL
jgi:hypothetical protein